MQNKTDKEDKPLTSSDVEHLIQEFGSPSLLDLSSRNLEKIDLAGFDLSGADLSNAKLSGANLFGANLSGANLGGADLNGANLNSAQLQKANMVRANLQGAKLHEANLSYANLSDANVRAASLHNATLNGATLTRAALANAEFAGANLSYADMQEANMYHVGLVRANLGWANLRKADLSSAILFGSILHGANLEDAEVFGANVSEATMTEKEKEALRGRGTLGYQEINVKPLELVIHIRVTEYPLTASNLSTLFLALTELSTKYWLIAKNRFADLIEYTQTHNDRFAEEAQVVITKISYNSPFNMDWRVDLSAPSVAEALVTTIDGIAQRRARLEKAKLENQMKAQEIETAEQKAEQENQAALLELEKQKLELEQRRLEVLEKQLEVQKKGIEYALEIAGKVVDTLHPGADPATRAMEIQALLPNLVQLRNGKGLELALPPPPSTAK